MGSPNSSTYDQSPAQRPTVDSFNGCVKEDDQEYPPDPSTMPNAAEANTTSLTIVSLGAMGAVGKISVTYTIIGPQIASSQFPNIATAFTPTIIRTPGGAASGDVTISWPAGAVPPSTTAPAVSLNGTALALTLSPVASLVANGVRVVTGLNVSGTATATDLPFTVVVH